MFVREYFKFLVLFLIFCPCLFGGNPRDVFFMGGENQFLLIFVTRFLPLWALYGMFDSATFSFRPFRNFRALLFDIMKNP